MSDRKKVTIAIGAMGVTIDDAQAQGLIQEGLIGLCGHCPNYHLTTLSALALATGKFTLDLSSVIDAEPEALPPAQQQRLDAILRGEQP